MLKVHVVVGGAKLSPEMVALEVLHVGAAHILRWMVRHVRVMLLLHTPALELLMLRMLRMLGMLGVWRADPHVGRLHIADPAAAAHAHN